MRLLLKKKLSVYSHVLSWFFFQELSTALGEEGTDDDTLIRVIISRCEIDMQYIKLEFANESKKSLDEAIGRNTSGNYRNFLLTLIGHCDSGLYSPRRFSNVSSSYYIVHNQALLNNPQTVLLPFTVQDQVAMDPSIRSPLIKTLQSFLGLGFKGYSEIWIQIFYIVVIGPFKQASKSSSRNFYFLF